MSYRVHLPHDWGTNWLKLVVIAFEGASTAASVASVLAEHRSLDHFAFCAVDMNQVLPRHRFGNYASPPAKFHHR